jgi:predicted nucleic acid-binding Zn ribbon protein
MPAPAHCPQCGADVPRNARACPECGSCEETGWSEEARSAGLELPDENFNYSDFVEREFGGKKARPRGISRFWWLVAILVAAALIVIILH